MNGSRLEARIWRAAAVATSLEAGLIELGSVLTVEGPRRPAQVRIAFQRRPSPLGWESLVEWVGDRAWRWADSKRRDGPPEAWKPVQSGGVLALKIQFGHDVAGAAMVDPIDERHAEAVAPALAEALAAMLSNELRRTSGVESTPTGSAARVRRSAGAEAIVGATAGLAPVLRRVEMVARQDVPVLLLGETGSGKEVVARAVHDRSRRAGGPFVRINCGAIPRDLIDSELFGHEKGSFTGAGERRHGWFERAHGGTLLLDEIGELPLDAQVRLLRILQDGSLTRVGGSQPVSVDVRIVGATHRDLPAMVDQRTFREDLWYRIATFPIRIPPLRERQDDIPDLVRHFVHKASVRFGLPEPAIAPAALDLLREYSWPGNVRELGAVIDRAMILGEGHRLEVAQALGLGGRVIPAPRPEPPALRPADGLREPRPTGLERGAAVPLDEAMKRHIEAELTRLFGRVEGPFGAAAALGINPQTLRSRMKKLGIDAGAFRRAARG